MKIFLNLEPPYEWVRVNGLKVEAFGEVDRLNEYPIGDDDEVVGVIPSAAVTMHRVTLPAKTRKQFATALPYALEESISEDVDKVHFVYPVWKAGEACNVYTVSKQTMRDWQALATDNQLPVQQLVPSHALVPFHEAAECSLALVGDQVVAHNKNGYGISLDRDLLDVWLLDMPVTTTIAVNDQALTETLIAEHPDRDFRHWPFGYKMAHWLEYPWHASVDLWGERYLPRVRRRKKGALLIPALLIGGAILLKFGYDTYRYISLHSEIAAIQREAQAVVKRAFPELGDVPAGSERALIERAIQQRQSPAAKKSVHSALAEVAAVLTRNKVTLTSIVYRNEELVVTCLLNNFSQVDLINTQLNAQKSISSKLQSSASEDGKVIASYSIRQR